MCECKPTWKERFKRAIALLTVGLVLVMWSLVCYVAGFSDGAYYSDFLSPQKGSHFEDPAVRH